ncbi:hypothetical protein JAAARDRAFT_322496 [Jaapia argillacea MUCL 33604]|uniref:Uncharacterized protein n=1 Tax=Jaapia argillacea MUCL 33604 TaxID=933084 RepID=A0A067PY33_9AGAM|nr:hypothetical protein JAAARDRAFT_322496 [Jaapia argillacea MUCL 33604]
MLDSERPVSSWRLCVFPLTIFKSTSCFDQLSLTLHLLSTNLLTMESPEDREKGSLPVSSGDTVEFPTSQWSDAVQSDFFYKKRLPEEWAVTIVEHCKEDGGKRHEYLRFTLEHSAGDRLLYLFAERAPERSKRLKQSGISGSAKAVDRIRISQNVKSREHEPLITLKSFDRVRSLTILQLSLLLKAASDAKPDYNLFTSQCFWFCAAVWGSIKTVFGGVEECGPKVGERFKIWNVSLEQTKSLRVSVGSIVEGYRVSKDSFDCRVQSQPSQQWPQLQPLHSWQTPQPSQLPPLQTRWQAQCERCQKSFSCLSPQECFYPCQNCQEILVQVAAVVNPDKGFGNMVESNGPGGYLNISYSYSNYLWHFAAPCVLHTCLYVSLLG